MARYSQLEQTFDNNCKTIEAFAGQVEWVIIHVRRTGAPAAAFDLSHDLIMSRGAELIRSGQLIYLTAEYHEWNAGICKNLGHFQATGDFIINLDIDNMISTADTERLLAHIDLTNTIYHGWCGRWGVGSCGMVGMSRVLFHRLGGYRENFVGFGADDIDLLRRAKANSGLPVQQFCSRKIIQNSDIDRIENVLTKEKTAQEQNLHNLALSRKYLRAGEFVSFPTESSKIAVHKNSVPT